MNLSFLSKHQIPLFFRIRPILFVKTGMLTKSKGQYSINEKVLRPGKHLWIGYCFEMEDGTEGFDSVVSVVDGETFNQSIRGLEDKVIFWDRDSCEHCKPKVQVYYLGLF